MIKKQINRLKDLLGYRELFFQLVSRDIKLRYRRSFLGYLWSVLNPLFTMIIMVIVFSNLFRNNIQHFPVYLLIGHLLFIFMNNATSRSLTSVISNASLLKKIYIPKNIFTLATITSELIIFFLSCIALFAVILISNVPVTWRVIFIIIPIIELYVFCIGLGLFLAQAAVFFRDMIYIWSVVTTAWLYLSAIFYPVDILPEKIKFLVTHFNPMYSYITMFRNFILGTSGMGSATLAIRGAIAAVIMLIAGHICFMINKNKFIYHI